jgi:hypothetical protein
VQADAELAVIAVGLIAEHRRARDPPAGRADRQLPAQPRLGLKLDADGDLRLPAPLAILAPRHWQDTTDNWPEMSSAAPVWFAKATIVTLGQARR